MERATICAVAKHYVVNNALALGDKPEHCCTGGAFRLLWEKKRRFRWPVRRTRVACDLAIGDTFTRVMLSVSSCLPLASCSASGRLPLGGITQSSTLIRFVRRRPHSLPITWPVRRTRVACDLAIGDTFTRVMLSVSSCLPLASCSASGRLPLGGITQSSTLIRFVRRRPHSLPITWPVRRTRVACDLAIGDTFTRVMLSVSSCLPLASCSASGPLPLCGITQSSTLIRFVRRRPHSLPIT